MQKANNVKSSYSLFAGIDISKEYFDETVTDQPGNKLNYDRFSNDEKGIPKFTLWLQETLKLALPSLLWGMEHSSLYRRDRRQTSPPSAGPALHP